MKQTELVLRPWNDVFELNGKLSYSESEQSWNTIRLRKPLLREFPDLKNKRQHIYYNITFYRTHTELEKKIQQIKKENQPLPLLLYFYKM